MGCFQLKNGSAFHSVMSHHPSICPFARSTRPEIGISRTSSQVVDPVGTRKSRPSTNLENAKSTSHLCHLVLFFGEAYNPLAPSLTYHSSFPVQVHVRPTPRTKSYGFDPIKPPSGDYIDLPMENISHESLVPPCCPLNMAPPVLSVARFSLRDFWYKLPEGFLKKNASKIVCP